MLQAVHDRICEIKIVKAKMKEKIKMFDSNLTLPSVILNINAINYNVPGEYSNSIMVWSPPGENTPTFKSCSSTTVQGIVTVHVILFIRVARSVYPIWVMFLILVKL